MKPFTACCALAVLSMLMSASTGDAQATANPNHSEAPAVSPAGAGGPDRSGFVEVVKLANRIRDIEKKATDEDPELKKLWEDVMALHEQYQKKLKAKLADNTEYQELSTRLDELRKQYRERRAAEGKKAPEPRGPKIGNP